MQECVGNTGRVGHLQLHAVHQTAGSDLRQTNALGIAVGLVGDVQDDYLLRLNAAGAVLGLDEPAGHVGVHTVAGNVLADLVHHQHVALVEQQVGDGLVGNFLQLGLLGDDLLGSQSLDEVSVVVGVLNDGNAAQDGRVLHDGPAVLLHQLVHDGGALMMDALGAFLLAQADGHHLHQAALIGAAEGGVGLDAVEEDNAVRLGGVLVDEYRLVADTGDADLDRLHGALDGAAHGLFGNAVIPENLGLALGGGTAVAAHSGHNVGLSALGLDEVHDGSGHQGVVVDAAAAAGNGDLLAGLNLAAQVLPVQLLSDDGGNLALQDTGLVKILPDLYHPRNGGVLDKVCDCFHIISSLHNRCSLDMPPQNTRPDSSSAA